MFALTSVLFATMMMISCSQEEVISKNNEGLTPLKFKVSTGKTTRANYKNANEIESLYDKTITVLVQDGDGESIDLTYNDATSFGTTDVFYLVPTNDGSATTVTTYLDVNASTPIELYLPADGTTVYFVALANSDPTVDLSVIGAITDGSKVTISNYTNTPQGDMLCAYAGPITYNGTSTSIILNFCHASAQLLFGVDKNADGPEDITINSLTVNVPATANLAFSGTSFTYDDHSMTNAAYTNDDIAFDDSENTSSASGNTNEFASLYVLPGSVDQTWTVTIDYSISNEDNIVRTGEKTIPFSSFPGISEWSSSMRYKYIFKPTPVVSSSGWTWSVAVSGTEWTDSSDSSIEPDTQP